MALFEILMFLALVGPGGPEAFSPAYHTGGVFYQSIDGLGYSSFSPRTLTQIRSASWCDRWHTGPTHRYRNVHHGGRYGWRGSFVGSFYFPMGRASYGYYGGCGPWSRGYGYSAYRGYRGRFHGGYRGFRGGRYGGYRCFRRPIIYVARY